MTNSKTNSKILRKQATIEKTGLSRSTIYLMMKSGTFPKNVQLGARAVGWLESDIQAWIDSRITANQA